MSGRLKFPPKAKKAKGGSKKTLDTADDFQQAADAEEETGGKWRAGDKAKSCRAFLRAIEIYDQGLSRFPRNFDLAYNKARLQFEVSEQPALVTHLPVSLPEYLEQALASHRYAIRLDESNTDILFNTAQLLSSLAEHSDADPEPLLGEALSLLDACLGRQRARLAEQDAAWSNDEPTSQTSAPPAPPSPSSNHSMESAIVESAVVPSDILDTLQASLSSLAALLPHVPANAISPLSTTGSDLISQVSQTIPTLPADEQAEATRSSALAQAEFLTSLSSAQFAASLISADDHLAQLNASVAPLDLARSEEACLAADALVEALGAMFTRSRDAAPLLPLLSRARQLYAHAIAQLDAEARPRRTAGALSLGLGDKEKEALSLAAGARQALGDAEVLMQRLTGDGVAEAVLCYADAAKGYSLAEDARAAAEVQARGRVAEGLVAGQTVQDKTAEEMRGEGLLD